jgi:hypothetical protein
MRLLLEFFNLWNLIEQVQLSPGVPDTFSWKLTLDGQYSASSAYGAMFVGSSTPLGAKLLWKTSAPHRVRFFFWLVLHRRCWTADRRRRHGLQDNDTCIICDQDAETMDHILLGCIFSREVWDIALRSYRLNNNVAVQQQDVMTWWTTARKQLPKELHRGFDCLVLTSWMLWKERNARTFNRIASTPAELGAAIRLEADLWVAAGYKRLAVLQSRVA